MYLCVPLLNSSSHSPRRRNSVFFPSFLLLFLSRLLLHKKNFHLREKGHALFCFKTNGENEIKSPSHDVDSRFLALNLCHVWDSRPEHSKLDDGNDDGFEASTFFVSNRERCAAGRLRSPSSSSSSSSENDNKRRFGAERRRYDGEFSAEFRKRGGGGGGGGKRFSRPVLFLLHLEKEEEILIKSTSADMDIETEEDLHPFRGRKPRPPPEKFTTRNEATTTSPEHVLDPNRMQIISLDHPRAFLYKRFMTDEECDFLIDHSKSRMSKSGVVDAETGGTAKSDIRTSTGSFVGIGANDLMKKLEKRVATFSMLPVKHQEATQVLRYEVKQEYRAHYDYFFHKGGMANNRIVTILMYLHEPEFGGETVFPNTEVPLERAEKGWGKNFSECGNRGRAAVVRKGDALIFWSMKPGGELDPGSSHAGCPVVRGEKWTATKWIHVNPTNQWNQNNHKVHYAGGPANSETCKDTNAACPGWAEGGECTANPGFMVNSCKVSCRQCVGGWRDGSYTKPVLS